MKHKLVVILCIILSLLLVGCKPTKQKNKIFYAKDITVEVLDKENPETWFDEDKKDLPTLEQCQEIKIGMSLDEVVQKIGKPQKDIGCGAILFQFDINDGSKIVITFFLNVDKENEYMSNHPEATVYGTHFLYVGEIDFQAM